MNRSTKEERQEPSSSKNSDEKKPSGSRDSGRTRRPPPKQKPSEGERREPKDSIQRTGRDGGDSRRDDRQPRGEGERRPRSGNKRSDDRRTQDRDGNRSQNPQRGGRDRDGGQAQESQRGGRDGRWRRSGKSPQSSGRGEPAENRRPTVEADARPTERTEDDGQGGSRRRRWGRSGQKRSEGAPGPNRTRRGRPGPDRKRGGSQASGSRRRRSGAPEPPPLDDGRLQGTFIPAARLDGGFLFLWASPEPRPEQIRRWTIQLGIDLDQLDRTRRILALPSASAPEIDSARPLRPYRLEGWQLPLADAIRELPSLDRAAASREIGDSVRAWILAIKLALELIARHQFLPRMRINAAGNEVRSTWAASLIEPLDAARYSRLAQRLPPAAYCLPKNAAAVKQRQNRGRPARTLWDSEGLLRAFLDASVSTLVRESIPPVIIEALRQQDRAKEWELRWMEALVRENAGPVTSGDDARRLSDMMKTWVGPALGRMAGESAHQVGLRVEMPTSTEDEDWRIRYVFQAADDPDLVIPAEVVWAVRGTTLRYEGRVIQSPQEEMLRGLGRASRLYPPIEKSLHDAHPTEAPVTTKQVWKLMSEAAPLLKAAGISVLFPPELEPEGQSRLRLRLRLGAPLDSGEAEFSMDGQVPYRWEAALGNEPIDQKQFVEIASLKNPLVTWNGRWILVDPGEVEAMAALFRKRATEGFLSGREALTAALLGLSGLAPGGLKIEVLPEGQFARVIARLKGEGFDEVAVPKKFRGELRPYQERGLHWLAGMAGLGLGACLADDMGLGKTIQIIALLLLHKETSPKQGRPTLLICPTSVVGNWERELAKFGPSLKVVRHHGADRIKTKSALQKQLGAHTICLTTYSLARRDMKLFQEIHWGIIILDEAQNVKNAASQQAQAVRSFPGGPRLALTGTPIENRLSELWSILDFTNAGLLGPLEKFQREFALPIERYHDEHAAKRLQRLTGPFILRRLKTDPKVISDLPEKQETTVFCSLTREQATLYQTILDESMASIEGSLGIERQGRVLALITRLKQICNHPAHYLGEDEPLRGRSGKLARLSEMIDEVVAEGDHCLVFTQYREMGELLVQHLEKRNSQPVPFLHGGVSTTQRDQMVETFQNDPHAPQIFVLSLKAGGTGLNLTRANHVFHFDRWWNPAVEDQATDRAFRIGQKRLVQVHKLVTLGTLEEKIDHMLIQKKALAESVVGTGEHWITEMADGELRELFSLSKDAAVEEMEES
ncbi:MAG: SNF2-related protein [Planctomycetota bacterium]